MQYARRHALNYNPAYRRWDGAGGDCTNFVSQALKHGGWQTIDGFKYSAWYWWYGANDESLTWVSVPWQYNFIASRRRGHQVSNVYSLQAGDVLAIDWYSDGRLDHFAVITGKDHYGEFYLSYHSNDRLDIPLSTVYAWNNYRMRVYAWRMNY